MKLARRQDLDEERSVARVELEVADQAMRVPVEGDGGTIQLLSCLRVVDMRLRSDWMRGYSEQERTGKEVARRMSTEMGR